MGLSEEKDPLRAALPEKHVSVSQLNRYRRCGYQDKLYQIHGPMAPGIAQHKGSVTHDLAANNLRGKRDHGTLFSTEAVRDMAADLFTSTIESKGLRLTDGDVATGEKAVLGLAKDWTVQACVFHAEEFAPTIEPDLIEVQVVSKEPLEVLEGNYLVGRIDVADTQRNVRDLKSTSSSGTVSQRVADTSPQLSIYSALYSMATGELPDAVMLDGLWIGDVKKDGTRSQKRLTFQSRHEWPQVNSVLSQLGTMVRAREAGIYLPVDASGPSGWVCTQKWCGYTGVCPHYRKEREV